MTNRATVQKPRSASWGFANQVWSVLRKSHARVEKCVSKTSAWLVQTISLAEKNNTATKGNARNLNVPTPKIVW